MQSSNKGFHSCRKRHTIFHLLLSERGNINCSTLVKLAEFKKATTTKHFKTSHSQLMIIIFYFFLNENGFNSTDL